MWLPSPGREANAAGPLPAFYCLWWPSGSWQLVHEGAIIGRGGKGRWAALSLSLWPCVCTLWLMGYVREISIWLEGRWWTQKCSSVFKFILCRGLPWWLSGKAPACQFRWCRFNPQVRGGVESPGEGNGNVGPPVFLPETSRGQGSLADYSPRDRKRISQDLVTKQQQQ